MQINLTPDYSLLMIMAIFMANYWVVRRFLVGPINGVIVARETDIRSADVLYEESLSRFNDATARIEEQLHQARKEASSRREKFRAEALAHRNQVIERTRGEAETIVNEADVSLRGDVEEARTKIVRESEELARLAAEKILGRKIA